MRYWIKKAFDIHSEEREIMRKIFLFNVLNMRYKGNTSISSERKGFAAKLIRRDNKKVNRVK